MHLLHWIWEISLISASREFSTGSRLKRSSPGAIWRKTSPLLIPCSTTSSRRSVRVNTVQNERRWQEWVSRQNPAASQTVPQPPHEITLREVRLRERHEGLRLLNIREHVSQAWVWSQIWSPLNPSGFGLRKEGQFPALGWTAGTEATQVIAALALLWRERRRKKSWRDFGEMSQTS